ncbi:MAG: ASCH domain-containing protein [Dichotomicrobium sp.]
MKALSIRQPWAWLILHAGKDIENRDWPTHFRGRFLIHTGKTMTRADYDEASEFAQDIDANIVIPKPDDLPRGGFVGTAKLIRCTDGHLSHWFTGPFGFELAGPRPLPEFVPARGRLGFFSASDQILVK